MLKNKILIKITGSIAAYKSAYLISLLVQNGFEVKTVTTDSALKFIGKATLEGLTNSTVYSDTFESGKMMSHINLIKWADLVIVVPADANTINKFANGIGDNLVTSLFLAHDFDKPYLIAPAMNTKMFNHPATQISLKKLKSWGIEILPTDDGYLACGDEGVGKLLSPDLIFNSIIKRLVNNNSNLKKVLITGGGTTEYIDGVRYIANLSTGKTAASIADYLFVHGVDVVYLKSETAVMPKRLMNIVNFNSFMSLKNKLRSFLRNNSIDYIIHLAAVSDYSPISISANKKHLKLPLDDKLSSDFEKIIIELTKNEKLINNIKNWSANKNIKLVAFKLIADTDKNEKQSELNKIFNNSNSDFIVCNSLRNRKKNVQNDFEITNRNGKNIFAKTSSDLAAQIYKLIEGETNDTLS